MEKGLKKSEFIQESDFRSVLYRPTLVNTEKTIEKLGENQKKIIELMHQNSFITIP